MDSLKFPIRISGGSMQALSSDSDEYYAQLIALTVQTRPGELILRPEYGIESPEFDAVQTAKFAQISAQFLPEINIFDVTTRPLDDGSVDISIAFERLA
jgi:hypothetical protein